MTPVRIKICGLTRLDDVALAGQLEVDAVGVVLWPGSPRAVSLADAARLCQALPPWTVRVGVFVSPTVEEVTTAVRTAGLGCVQIHGAEDARPYLALGVPLLWAAAVHPDTPDPVTPPGATLLLDAHDPVRHGGTGHVIDWSRAQAIGRRERRLVLAGGLTAENVQRAIALVAPYGVDTSSGVETTPGIKSAARMQAFVHAARTAPVTSHA